MLDSTQIPDFNYKIAIDTYTPVLMPLKNRDWKVLVELFERADIEEIEANIHSNLLMMIPEPCWEDDPFDFLSEYL